MKLERCPRSAFSSYALIKDIVLSGTIIYNTRYTKLFLFCISSLAPFFAKKFRAEIKTFEPKLGLRKVWRK